MEILIRGSIQSTKLHGHLDNGDQIWHSAAQRCTEEDREMQRSGALCCDHRHVAHLTINVLAGMSELKDRKELLL